MGNAHFLSYYTVTIGSNESHLIITQFCSNFTNGTDLLVLAAYRSSIPLIFMVVAFEHTFLYVLNLSSHLSSNSIGTWLRFAIAILGLVTEAARLVLTQKLLQGQV